MENEDETYGIDKEQLSMKDNRPKAIIYFDTITWILLLGLIIYVIFLAPQKCDIVEQEGKIACITDTHVCEMIPIQQDKGTATEQEIKEIIEETER